MKAQRIGLSFPMIHQPSKVVFHGLSFELPSKGLVVITGDSGIGKTSLLAIISGQKKPSKGKIIHPNSWKINPPLYLEDQLTLIPTWYLKDFIPNPDANDFLNQLELPLSSRKKRFQELSGGQKIRFMVALFFSQPSACYLLDEPTHALDEDLRTKMIAFLAHQANTELIVVATHDQELIAKANHELNLRSIYDAKWIDHEINVGTLTKVSNPNQKKMKQHWLRKLFWLHRGQSLGVTLSIASLIIHVGLLFTGFIHHTLTQQSIRYQEMKSMEPFLSIQEVQTTQIHQSPFQLTKSQAPDHEQLALAISMVKGASVMTSIAEWFPQSMTIDHLTFDLRFIDLPYQEGGISVVWIYPNIALPNQLEISSIQWTNTIPYFSHHQQLKIIHKRPIQSWFEPPQLLLSYWQWLHLLQSNTVVMDGEQISYFNLFQKMHPPTSLLIYDSNDTLKETLSTNPNHHPWTYSQAIEKTYELKLLLLSSTQSLTQLMVIGLWILGIFLWSTRLHWIYQRHHVHWRWLQLFHLPMKRIWQAISLRAFFNGFVVMGIVQSVTIYLVNQFHFIPGTSFINLVIMGWFIFLIQQITRYFIQRWYAHA